MKHLNKSINIMTIIALSLLATTVGLFMGTRSLAYLTDPYFVDGPQDRLQLDLSLQWHELGTNFPSDELIESRYEYTDRTSCFETPDDPDVPNFLVSITNLSATAWKDLHYVADLDITAISDFDGYIGNAGAQDAWYAFRIDNVGINKPLVSESIKPDLIFQPGETWEFILQDFRSPQPPAALGSFGIAGKSVTDEVSSGSIIATPVPVPGSGLLLALGLAALVIKRRDRVSGQ